MELLLRERERASTKSQENSFRNSQKEMPRRVRCGTSFELQSPTRGTESKANMYARETDLPLFISEYY